MVYNNKRGLASSFLYKLFMNKKTIITVLFILLAGFGVWHLVPKDYIATDEVFKGVEMTTLRNDYFEITYPKAWLSKDKTDVYYKKVLNATDIEPIEVTPAGTNDYLMMIIVEDGTFDTLAEEIRSGGQVSRNIADLSALEPTTLNGMNGLKKPLREPGAYYFFEKDGKLYTINFFYDPALKISEAEALHVLSTFKILN